MKRAAPPNYTQIPNCILDRLGDYSDAELRVILIVCRNTLGWHKEKVILTLRLAAQFTGMTENGCGNALKTLLGEQVIDRVKVGKTFAYRLAIFDESPNGVGSSEEPSTQARCDISPNAVGSAHIGKKDRLKEIKTGSGEGEKPINQHQAFIELWVESYEMQFGRKYKFEGAKDGTAAKQLLASTGKTPKELIDIATRAWAKKHGDCFNCKRIVTISVFNSAFNQVLAELDPPGGPTKTKEPPPGLKPFSQQPPPGFDEAMAEIGVEEWKKRFPLTLYYDDVTKEALS